jgi:hypothetical protein
MARKITLKITADRRMKDSRDNVKSLTPEMLTAWDEEILLRRHGLKADDVYGQIIRDTDRDYQAMRSRMGRPKVTRVPSGFRDEMRRRFEGGKMAAHERNAYTLYLARPETSITNPSPAYCDVTVSLREGTAGRVLSFGGTVWVGAWPHLFDCPSNLASRCPHMTDLGMRYVLGAEAS